MHYYFAWQPDGLQPFTAAAHVNDEDVFSWTIDHAEGDFAALRVDIINPRVGMLRADRDQWVWFSVRLDSGAVIPLFHGRLVGVPENLQNDVISIEFIGRPADYETQRVALADSMRVFPYFDRVWIPEASDDDPDAVLEGYGALWHIGRTDKTLTASNINLGEGTTWVVGESDIFTDTMSLTYGSEPFTRITMSAEVSWDQKASGSVDITEPLHSAFAVSGSKRGQIWTYTGQGLESDWPLKGDDIGGGWTVGENTLVLLSGAGVTPTYIDSPIQATSTDEATSDPEAARFYMWVFSTTFSVDYSTSRSRSEKLTFTVDADMQDIDASSEPDVEAIDYSSSRVTALIDNGGTEMPIGLQHRRTYFGLDRGQRSIEYLLCICRARFMKAARAVQITFECDFEQFITISCRDNFLIHSPRLPNGEAQGKVTSYEMSADGSSGETKLSVTVAATIGKGDPTVAASPVRTYAVDDYDVDYEESAGGSIEAVSGQIAYTRPIVTPVDDNVDFDKMTPANCIIYARVNNGPNVQRPVCKKGYTSVDEAVTALNAVHTTVELNLTPVDGGPFDLVIPVTVAPFAVPKTIDLES